MASIDIFHTYNGLPIQEIFVFATQVELWLAFRQLSSAVHVTENFFFSPLKWNIKKYTYAMLSLGIFCWAIVLQLWLTKYAVCMVRE
jgi:hypothetical protein